MNCSKCDKTIKKNELFVSIRSYKQKEYILCSMCSKKWDIALDTWCNEKNTSVVEEKSFVP